jgi:sugar/nucleoside kinase (ribokinase family)
MSDRDVDDGPGRVVLGLGGTVDYEVVWHGDVVGDLVAHYGISVDELDHDGPIDTERALMLSLLRMLRDGSGGERFVASSAIIERLAQRMETRVTLGGTCVRAAIAMSTLEVPSTLHLVSMNDATRRLLPSGVAWISSATEDSTHPHLIIQYPRGARVRVGDREVVAPRANRLIFANDPPHRELVLSDDLDVTLAGAEVLLLSSLNVIQDPSLLEARLGRLQEAVRSLPDDALVMFEDAGYHIPAFAARVREVMAPLVDVYSCNEDELQDHLGRTVDLDDPTEVAAAVEDFASILGTSTLVVHTTHWALAFGSAAARYEHALRGGAALAATRYRLGDGFRAAQVAETMALPPQAAGVEVARGVVAKLSPEVACVPSYDAETDAPTTIGLGDTFVGGFLAALAAPSAIPASGATKTPTST